MKTQNYRKEGSLPFQTIQDMMEAGFIKNSKEKNIRPASLDLSLSSEIYKVDGVFQPREGETVRQVISKLKKQKYSLDKPLEKGCIYLVRLNESLDLPDSIYAFCNPKSSSGRIDVHVRLISDGVMRYDSVPRGFKGELWISIMPKIFPIKLYENVSLNQIRFFNADTRLNEFELQIALSKYGLIWQNSKPASYKELKTRDNDNSVILTLAMDLKNIGYEGIVSNNVVDLSKIKFYDYKKFFKPLQKKGDYVYLKKDSFYILSTHESIKVPPELVCEMVPMDERSGEFRSHYAGFIDPGWGWGKRGEGKGRPLTLEVRPFEDLVVRKGQPIGKIKFERVIAIPDVTYDSIDSNYLVQEGPKLAKHFK